MSGKGCPEEPGLSCSSTELWRENRCFFRPLSSGLVCFLATSNWSIRWETVFPLGGLAEKQGWRSWMLPPGEISWGIKPKQRGATKRRETELKAWMTLLNPLDPAKTEDHHTRTFLDVTYIGETLPSFLSNLLQARIQPYATKGTPTAIKLFLGCVIIYNWIPAKSD